MKNSKTNTFYTLLSACSLGYSVNQVVNHRNVGCCKALLYEEKRSRLYTEVKKLER